MRIGTAVLVLVLTVASSPAEARKSACEAPPTSVTRSQETELAAKVEARIRTLASAKGEVQRATATEFDTVLMSSDAVERSWLIYQLCKQAERGLVGWADYRVERQLILGVPQPGDDPSGMPQEEAESGENPAFVAALEEGEENGHRWSGSWIIEATLENSTCTVPPERASVVENWSMRAGTGGHIDVSPVSDSDFPVLNAVAVDEYTMVLDGAQRGRGAVIAVAPGQRHLALTQVQVILTLQEDGRVAGTRVVSAVDGPTEDGAVDRLWRGCARRYEVVGRRAE